MTYAKPRFLVVGLAYIAFISLGMPDGLLGVAWPSIRATFNLPLDALGSLLIVSTTGYGLSSFSSGWILRRINVGTLLALSVLATATSLLGYGVSPAWLGIVALGFVAGYGAGAIDASLNTYGATNFDARTLNWLHAFFGVGAAVGPLIMTAVISAERPWQQGYFVVGGVQLVLAICFGLTRRWWETPVAQHEAPPAVQASARQTLRLPAAWLSIAIFVFYAGIEVTAGQWAYSLFTLARETPATTAGVWISVYWASLTVGRFVFGSVVGLVSVDRLLRWCLIAIGCGAVLLWINLLPLLSFLGLALIGLALAPIFPSLIAMTPERLGADHTANAIGFEVAGASLGAAVLPWFVGQLASRFGLEVIGPFLVAAALLLGGSYVLLAHYHARASTARTATPDVAFK